jgi:hypothetical protein
MKQVVRTLVAAGPDAIQLSVGLAPLLQSQPGRDKPALVLRSDVANVYGPEPPSEPFSVVVDDAVGHWERASGQAAEGIRTLDLLHGKQCLRSAAGPLSPCNQRSSDRKPWWRFSRLSPSNHGSLWTEQGPERQKKLLSSSRRRRARAG